MVSEPKVQALGYSEALVLILVVVEYGLGVSLRSSPTRKHLCLNPCCGGIWSRRKQLLSLLLMGGLNPCCGGIWSRSVWGLAKNCQECLNPCCGGIWSRRDRDGALSRQGTVLILVVVEYGLGARNCRCDSKVLQRS